MLFIVQITSLADITRRNRGCVTDSSESAPFASGTAAFKTPLLTDDFRESNGEAFPYLPAKVVRGLAPSSAKFTGKPSRAFHG